MNRTSYNFCLHSILWLIVVLSVIPSSTCAQVATAKEAVLEERYPQPQIKFPGGVTGLPDLTYSTIPGYRQLKLDLYLPPGKTTAAKPLVIYVAGGGWLADRPRNAGPFEDWPGVFVSLAKKGYVIA